MQKKNNILLGQLFPNPPLENGRVFLACIGNVDQPVSVQIRSKDGRLVYQSAHCLANNGGTIELHLPALPGGSYAVFISCGSFSGTKELIVLKVKKTKTWKTLFSWFVWRRAQTC